MRQFIQEIQKSRGLSVGELSALLGYKSQTSVARIMQDKANMDSVTRFCQLLKENETIALTDSEASSLDRILEKKKLGSDEYAATDTLRQFLREDPPLVDPVLADAYTGEKHTLLERYLPMQGLKITVLNCETLPLFGALAQLTGRGIAKVEHYLYSDQNLLRTVMTIRSVLPILHDENYYGAMAFCTHEELLSNPRGILLADVMFTEYTEGEQSRFDLVIFQNTGEGMRFSFPVGAANVHRMMDSVKAIATPIRNAGLGGFENDYVAYIRYCSELEKDRAVYRIKPDFGMEQVPLKTWERAFRDGPLADDSIFDGMAEALAEVFVQRQQNALTKKQAQHHVFKQRAVWRFVRTGRLSDQFWGFDALTMKERMETLQSVLEQHTTNPYYQVYFLKDEDAMRDDEIVFYDGLGLSIIKAGTDYNLTANHSETMVTQGQFLRVYRNFFLHSILPYNVQPEYKTRKILMEMIEYCQTHMDE